MAGFLGGEFAATLLLGVGGTLLWAGFALAFALCLIFTLALVTVLAHKGGIELGGLSVGQLAPAFTAETPAGQSVSARTYAGQATAMIFIGPNCSHCVKTLPLIKELQPQAAQVGIQFVLISDGSREETQACIERHSIDSVVWGPLPASSLRGLVLVKLGQRMERGRRLAPPAEAQR